MDTWEDKYHSQIFKLLSKVVPLFVTIEQDEEFEFSYINSRLDNNKKQEIFLILTDLYYCDCCVKHQYNKPCLPNKYVPTGFRFTTTEYCECDCRHLSRMICRMCED